MPSVIWKTWSWSENDAPFNWIWIISDAFQVDLRHLEENFGSTVVEMGVDLSEFYMSVEWDVLAVPATR